MNFEFDKIEKLNAANLFCPKIDFLIGTDEAGRGPGAGDVYAAAVCFKDLDNLSELLPKLNDSKKLTEKERLRLFPLIKQYSYFAVNAVSVKKIEEINILNASLLAMKLSVSDVISQMNSNNVIVLVDGNKPIKEFNYPQKTVIKGDSLSASIAAASILAKVSRDNYMMQLHNKFPCYNFKKNKGYLTKEHIEAIKAHGVCEFHRKSFLGNIF